MVLLPIVICAVACDVTGQGIVDDAVHNTLIADPDNQSSFGAACNQGETSQPNQAVKPAAARQRGRESYLLVLVHLYAASWHLPCLSCSSVCLLTS